jgi:hypothetical protein
MLLQAFIEQPWSEEWLIELAVMFAEAVIEAKIML